MKYLEQILTLDVWERLGWTLVHSLWQGLLIGLVAGLLLIFLRRYTAKTKYFVLYAALVLILTSSIVTYLSISIDSPRVPDPSGEPAVRMMMSGQGEYLPEDPDPEAPAGQTEMLFNWLKSNTSLIALLWLLGAVFFSIRMAGGLIYIKGLKLKSFKTTESHWECRTRKLAEGLGIRRQIGLYESAMVTVPIVAGVIKPVILVPLGMLSNVPPVQLETLLYHELIHIRRKDYLLNLVQSLLEVLFFYHPAVWWLSYRIRTEREHICDDEVVLKYGKNEYFRALAVAVEWETKSPQLVAALASGRSQLINRIKRMMKTSYLKRGTTEGIIAVTLMAAAVFAFAANAAISMGPDDTALLDERFENTSEITGLAPVSSARIEPGIRFVSIELLNNKSREHSSIKQDEPRKTANFTSLNPDTLLTEEEKQRIREEVERAKQELEQVRQSMEKAFREREEELRELRKTLEEQQKMIRKETEEVQKKIREEIIIEMEDGIHSWSDSANNYFYRFNDDSLGKGPRYFYFNGEEGLFEPGDLDFDFDTEEFEEKMKEYEFKIQEYGSELGENLAKIYRHRMPDKWAYNYHYDPGEYMYHNKTEKIIRQELIEDGLIERGGDYVIELNDRQMLINGEKQPRSVYQKYKRLYESMEDEEIKGDFRYKLVF